MPSTYRANNGGNPSFAGYRHRGFTWPFASPSTAETAVAGVVGGRFYGSRTAWGRLSDVPIERPPFMACSLAPSLVSSSCIMGLRGVRGYYDQEHISILSK